MAPRDLIVVDIGNSFVKLQVSRSTGSPWDSGDPMRLETAALAAGDWRREPLTDWLRDAGVATSARWLVATVHGAAEHMLRDWVRDQRPADAYYRLEPGDVPLDVDVDYPERVGVDRLLNALAVNQLRAADCPAVIVDAGSAVTVDAVVAADRFLGGAILPGLRMATAALSHATDQLPLAGPDVQQWPAVIGRSTHEAIRSGVLWGTLGAVREISRRMADELGPGARVFVTGGDSSCLQRLADERTEFRPNLVLAGIRLLETRLRAELSPP